MPSKWSGSKVTGLPDGMTHWFGINLNPPKDFRVVFPASVEIFPTLRSMDSDGRGNPDDIVGLIKGLIDQLGENETLSYPLTITPEGVQKLQNNFEKPVNGNDLVVVPFGLPLIRPRPKNVPKSESPARFRQGIERVIVVIDADIAFAHERFRLTKNETRIAWFWDMDANKFDLESRIGRFMYQVDIDTYLRKLDGSSYGEPELYKDYITENYTCPQAAYLPSVYAHGTHVLDVAVGNTSGGPGDDPNINNKTAIFAIQLPRDAVAHTHGVFLTQHILSALRETVCHAKEIENQHGTYPEILVNISVGGHGGRHDGYSRLERRMDEMLTETPECPRKLDGIFLPAGNSYDTKTHARLTGYQIKNLNSELSWRVRPDDGTASFLEIWTPPLPAWSAIDVSIDSRPIQLLIKPPGRVKKTFEFHCLQPGYHHELIEDGEVLARLYVDDDSGRELSDVKIDRLRRRYLLAVRHTQRNREANGNYSGGRPDLAGDWKIEIEVKNCFPDNEIMSAWIVRDDEILRLRSGAKQSIFPDIATGLGKVGNPKDPDGVVNDGTISDMAAGKKTCVVAAHLAENGTPTEYSSEGIDQVKSVVKRNIHPTVSAIADESKEHPGLIAAGFFSGSNWRQGGTSVSSPLALRQMLDFRRVDGVTVKGLLADKAMQADPIDPKDENRPKASRIGIGRLDTTNENLPHPKRRRRSRS